VCSLLAAEPLPPLMCTMHEERSEEIKKKKTQHPRGKKKETKGTHTGRRKKKKKASRALPQSFFCLSVQIPFVRSFLFFPFQPRNSSSYEKVPEHVISGLKVQRLGT